MPRVGLKRFLLPNTRSMVLASASQALLRPRPVALTFSLDLTLILRQPPDHGHYCNYIYMGSSNTACIRSLQVLHCTGVLRQMCNLCRKKKETWRRNKNAKVIWGHMNMWLYLKVRRNRPGAAVAPPIAVAPSCGGLVLILSMGN